MPKVKGIRHHIYLMKVSEIEINDFLGKSDSFFSIPIYQRNYDWQETQCKKLLKDIMNVIDAIKDGKHDPGHFLGTAVFIRKERDDGLNEYLVIDGQQRLMTLIIMLKAIYDLIDTSNPSFLRIKNVIYENYLQIDSFDGIRKFKLKPILSDLEMYDSIMAQNIKIDLHRKYESRVVENYKFFKKQIEAKLNIYSAIDFYNAFKKLYIVSINLDTTRDCENPQLVFESLNSTGLNLTQGDLIRNFLLMRAKPNKQEIYYNDYWVNIEKNCGNNETLDDFLFTFTEMRTQKIVQKDNYYERFKSKYSDDDSILESTMDDLKKSSLCYAYIVGNAVYPSVKINKLLGEFRELGKSTTSSTIKPILVYLLVEHINCSQIFNETELLRCLDVLLSYVYRRFICGRGTTSTKNVMLTALRDMEDRSDGNYYSSILNALCTSNFESGFILNTELKEALTMGPIRDKSLINYTFKKISNNMSALNDKWDGYTIEHIMPKELTLEWQQYLGRDYQNIHETYLDYIGNLSLVNNNSELSNKTYPDKKESYGSSSFYLTKQICTYQLWNKKSILQRCEDIYQLIIEIWRIPAEYNEIIERKKELDCSKQYTFAKPRDVTGYKPHWIKFGEEDEVYVKTWKEVFEKFLDYVYQKYPEALKAMIRNGQVSRISLDDKNSKFNQLDNGLYVPFSLSSATVVNECSRVVNGLKIYDNIKFYIKRREE